MAMENYGKIWKNDHCTAISSFNLLKENEVKNVSVGLSNDLFILMRLYEKDLNLIINYNFKRKLEQFISGKFMRDKDEVKTLIDNLYGNHLQKTIIRKDNYRTTSMKCEVFI